MCVFTHPTCYHAVQISVLINGDLGLTQDRTRLTDEAEQLFKEPEFLSSLAKTLQSAKRGALGQPTSTFGKLMARIDKDSHPDSSRRLAVKAE